jgi:hypothetical protein
MRRCIYKYPLEITDKQELAIPENAKVLSVGSQGGQLFVWIEHVYPAISGMVKCEHFTFFIKGTGHAFEDNALLQPTFLGTVLMAEGSLVWHVYYQKED